jgi:hypothetical protein
MPATPTEYLHNGQLVTILQSAGRGQVLVETADGTCLVLFKAGLSTKQTSPVAISSLKVDTTRGTDGAR